MTLWRRAICYFLIFSVFYAIIWHCENIDVGLYNLRCPPFIGYLEYKWEIKPFSWKLPYRRTLTSSKRWEILPMQYSKRCFREGFKRLPWNKTVFTSSHRINEALKVERLLKWTFYERFEFVKFKTENESSLKYAI